MSARPADTPPSLSGVEHRWVEVRGTRLHVAEAGSGPPLLLLHGWPQNWWCWRHLIPVLAQHFRVLCPDMRGFGWSDAPRTGYDKEALAIETVALLDRMGVARTAVIGHDWGGWIALLLAARHPARIERVMALSIAPPWLPRRAALATVPRAWYQLVAAAPVPPRVGAGIRARLVRAGVRRAIPALATVTEDDLDILCHGLSEPDRDHAAASLYRAFILRELPSILAGRYDQERVGCPVLLITGTRDPVIRPRLLDGFTRQVPLGRTQEIPGAGHFLLDECPDEVLRAALAFLLVARTRAVRRHPGDGAATSAR